MADPTKETPGWRAVGVVLDGDAIDLDGVNPWRHAWESTGELMSMRHPTWPTQLHELPVYTITDGARRVTFAAGELSNTVWGFALPIAGSAG